MGFHCRVAQHLATSNSVKKQGKFYTKAREIFILEPKTKGGEGIRTYFCSEHNMSKS